MNRSEALDWIVKGKWMLADSGQMGLAGEFEDAELRVARNSPKDLKLYARFLIPVGRRGRIHLVLQSSYGARATALLFGILMNVEEDT